MNVKQLKERLENKRDEDEVVVEVSRGQPSVGSRSTVMITSVSEGFDWDNGKVFLKTSEPVSIQDKQTEYAKRFYDAVIQSWSLAKIAGWEKQFTQTLKSHFKDMLEYSGMGDYIDQHSKETIELREKAKNAKNKI
jgi:hypothetical protein